ncbi:MAG: DUF3800 domain-containing protein [Candidatus Rokuibacteriota bacterium]
MHIFVDESGTHGRNADAVSVVGALTIPEARLARIEEKYAALRPDLPEEKGEVKGRLLGEADVARVVTMLLRYEVLFEVTAIDLAVHRPEEVVSHQMAQAEGITHNLTEQHSQETRRRFQGLRNRLERMAPQLYTQAVVTFATVRMVIEHSTMFYAQRHPKELGAFYWVIDGKDRNGITDWEEWWSAVVASHLQWQSFSNPVTSLEGADYSHFARFERKVSEGLKPYFKGEEYGQDGGMIVNENFRCSSRPEPGLELVDILTNAVRRALTGRLLIEGWRDIRGLMIHRKRPYIQLVALRDAAVPSSYEGVVRQFTDGGKLMLSPRFRREAGRQTPGAALN